MQSSKVILFLVLVICLSHVLLAAKRLRKVSQYHRHHRTTTNNKVASDDAEKISIDVYYETQDFFSLQFITTEVYPTMQAQGLSEIINLRLIPFGKANETIGKNGQYQFKCEYGLPDCEGNMYQACAIALKGNSSAEALPFIDCMSFNLYERFLDPLPAAHDCAPRFDIDTVQLDTCVNGELGNQVMHQMALATKSLKPTPDFLLPWLSLNGQTGEWVKNYMEFNMLRYVCSLYKGPQPAGCKY